MKNKTQEVTFESYLKKVSNQKLEKRKSDKYSYNEVSFKDVRDFFKPENLRVSVIRLNLARRKAREIKEKFLKLFNEIKQNINKGALWVLNEFINPLLEWIKDSFIYKMIKELIDKIKESFENQNTKKKSSSKKDGLITKAVKNVKKIFGHNSNYEYEVNNKEFYNENFNLPFSKLNPGNVIKITYKVKEHKIIINSITGEAIIEGKNPTLIWKEIFPSKDITGNSYKWNKKEWIIIRKYIEGGSETSISTDDKGISTDDKGRSTDDKEPIPLDKLEERMDMKKAEEEEEKNPKSPMTLFQKIIIGLGISILIGFVIIMFQLYELNDSVKENNELLKENNALLKTVNSNLMTVQHNILTSLAKVMNSINANNQQNGKFFSALNEKIDTMKTVQGLQIEQAQENAKGVLEWCYDKIIPTKGIEIPTSNPDYKNYLVKPEHVADLERLISSAKDDAKGVDIIKTAADKGWVLKK